MVYASMLVLPGILLTVALIYAMGIRDAGSWLALGIFIGSVVLMLMIRIAPFLVKPTLVLRKLYEPVDRLITLNLASVPKDESQQ